MVNIGSFGSLFDLNRAGEIGCVENAIDFTFLEDLMEEDTESAAFFDAIC